ncbi:MAG: hypothetical protein ICV81_02885 [Flavisolibacter sp.]|nr:hypothetical protein [Flavisolibacter sp.]MBD0286143.1 hypothetical protein [Flavisolibacter sp.]MBD0352764.1 hypothetical protein [Flavisolibacter sp.]
MENKLIPALLIVLLSIVSVGVVFIGLWKALTKTDWPVQKKKAYFIKAATGILIWIILISLLTLAGLFKDLSQLPPKPVILLLPAIVILFLVAFSKSFTQLLRVTPPQWLVYIQSFRIGVEIFLWLAFVKKLMPVQMTWEGYNFDILSGLLALPAGWLMQRYPDKVKTVGVVYNVIGLLLLLNVLIIAVLSMPTPIRKFMNEPPVVIVGHFPFIFLPSILVLLAFAMHIFSLRQLFLRNHK